MGRTPRIAAVLLGLTALVAAAACAPRPVQHATGSSGAVQQTVVLYNGLLAEGFATQNMSALDRVATTDQAYQEYYQMAAIGEAKRRMVPTLVKLDFTSIDVGASESTATARTAETWDYVQLSTSKDDSGTVVMRQTGVAYRLVYHLVRKGDRWYVSAVEDQTGGGK